MHFDAGEVVQDGRNVGECGPVVLDVLARGEVAIAASYLRAIWASIRNCFGIERTVGDGDAQHIGVQLQVDAVHQPERTELHPR